jgi:hypothetical protein
VFATFLVGLVIHAGTRDDAVEDQRYIDYGKGFAAYTVPVTSSKGKKREGGTATLISHRWAITAAHIVDGMDEAEIGGRKASRIVVHPQYDSDCMCCYDAALLCFDEPFGLRRYPPLSTGGEKPHDVVSIAGFGATGPMSTGFDTSDGLLRAGTAKIASVDGGKLICRIARRSSPLPIGIAPGDSGGPLFCGGKLAGIASCTAVDGKGELKSRHGEDQCFTSVAAIRDWIEETTK